jgi:hypothetical protein
VDYPADAYEVVVVDNAPSTEHTAALLAGEHRWARYVREPRPGPRLGAEPRDRRGSRRDHRLHRRRRDRRPHVAAGDRPRVRGVAGRRVRDRTRRPALAGDRGRAPLRAVRRLRAGVAAAVVRLPVSPPARDRLPPRRRPVRHRREHGVPAPRVRRDRRVRPRARRGHPDERRRRSRDVLPPRAGGAAARVRPAGRGAPPAPQRSPGTLPADRRLGDRLLLVHLLLGGAVSARGARLPRARAVVVAAVRAAPHREGGAAAGADAGAHLARAAGAARDGEGARAVSQRA